MTSQQPSHHNRFIINRHTAASPQPLQHNRQKTGTFGSLHTSQHSARVYPSANRVYETTKPTDTTHLPGQPIKASAAQLQLRERATVDTPQLHSLQRLQDSIAVAVMNNRHSRSRTFVTVVKMSALYFGRSVGRSVGRPLQPSRKGCNTFFLRRVHTEWLSVSVQHHEAEG